MADELDPNAQDDELGRAAKEDARDVANDDMEEFEDIADDDSDDDVED